MLVLGDIARDNGLKESLLERLERRYYDIQASDYVIHLDINYRCHPDIAQFLSKVIYKYPLIFITYFFKIICPSWLAKIVFKRNP